MLPRPYSLTNLLFHSSHSCIPEYFSFFLFLPGVSGVPSCFMLLSCSPHPQPVNTNLFCHNLAKCHYLGHYHCLIFPYFLNIKLRKNVITGFQEINSSKIRITFLKCRKFHLLKVEVLPICI